MPFLKRLLDMLALHKLNRFHWHLTEDQVSSQILDNLISARSALACN